MRGRIPRVAFSFALACLVTVESIVMATIAETIAENAAGPQKAQTDAGSMEMPDLSKLIEYEKHLAGKTAAALPSRGLRITKLVPPGIS